MHRVIKLAPYGGKTWKSAKSIPNTIRIANHMSAYSQLTSFLLALGWMISACVVLSGSRTDNAMCCVDFHTEHDCCIFANYNPNAVGRMLYKRVALAESEVSQQ